MAGFRELKVWQRAKACAVKVYKISDSGALSRDFGLRDQLRRSAVSVCSNIAEGDERDTNPEAVRFFRIAKGSIAELRTQLEIAMEVGFLGIDDWEPLEDELKEIARMLGALIRVRSGSKSKLQSATTINIPANRTNQHSLSPNETT